MRGRLFACFARDSRRHERQTFVGHRRQRTRYSRASPKCTGKVTLDVDRSAAARPGGGLLRRDDFAAQPHSARGRSCVDRCVAAQARSLPMPRRIRLRPPAVSANSATRSDRVARCQTFSASSAPPPTSSAPGQPSRRAPANKTSSRVTSPSVPAHTRCTCSRPSSRRHNAVRLVKAPDQHRLGFAGNMTGRSRPVGCREDQTPARRPSAACIRRGNCPSRSRPPSTPDVRRKAATPEHPAQPASASSTVATGTTQLAPEASACTIVEVARSTSITTTGWPVSSPGAARLGNVWTLIHGGIGWFPGFKPAGVVASA